MNIYLEKTAKKRYLLLILVPTTHIPHTHFGTHLVWVTKLTKMNIDFFPSEKSEAYQSETRLKIVEAVVTM